MDSSQINVSYGVTAINNKDKSLLWSININNFLLCTVYLSSTVIREMLLPMISVNRRQHTVLSEKSSLPLRCPLLLVSMLRSSAIFLTFTSLSSSLPVLSVSQKPSLIRFASPQWNARFVCVFNTRFLLSKGGRGEACPGLRLREA